MPKIRAIMRHHLEREDYARLAESVRVVRGAQHISRRDGTLSVDATGRVRSKPIICVETEIGTYAEYRVRDAKQAEADARRLRAAYLDAAQNHWVYPPIDYRCRCRMCDMGLRPA